MASPFDLTSEEARALLQRYAAQKEPLNLERAESILRDYLRARHPPDRWGNYPRPDGKRFHFAARTLHLQERYLGAWRNVSSSPLLVAALSLLGDAAVVANDVDAAARIDRERAHRVRAGDRREKRARDDAAALTARQTAFRDLAFRSPREILRGLGYGPKLTPRALGAFQEELRALTDRYRADPSPPGVTFARVDQPPVLPLVRPLAYRWAESVGEARYTVRVQPVEEGVATVEIGSGAGLSVNASTRAVRSSSRADEGDAYLAGRVAIDRKTARISATLFLITSRRPMAGTQALGLWCRMMRGYGVDRWFGEAMSADGDKMFRALERLGRIRVVSRSLSDVVVECSPGAP